MELIEYKGKQYTLKELAITFNIKYDTLLHRKKRGWTIDEIVEGKSLPRNGKEVIVYNKKYGSINEAACKLHMTPYEIKKVLNNKPFFYPIVDHKEYKNVNQVKDELNLTVYEVRKVAKSTKDFTIKIYNENEHCYYYFKNEQEMYKYYDVDNINEIGEPIYYG